MFIKINNMHMVYLMLLISGIYINAAPSSSSHIVTADASKTLAEIFHSNPGYNLIIGTSIFGTEIVITKYANIIHSDQCQDIDLSGCKLAEIFTLCYSKLDSNRFPRLNRSSPSASTNLFPNVTLKTYNEGALYVKKLDEDHFACPVGGSTLFWSLDQLYARVSLAIRDYFDGDYLFTLRLTNPDNTPVQAPGSDTLNMHVTPNTNLICKIDSKLQVEEDVIFRLPEEMSGGMAAEDLTSEIDRILIHKLIQNNQNMNRPLYSGNAVILWQNLGVSTLDDYSRDSELNPDMQFQIPSQGIVCNPFARPLLIPVFVNGVFDSYFYTNLAYKRLGINPAETEPILDMRLGINPAETEPILDMLSAYLPLNLDAFSSSMHVQRIHIVQDNNIRSLRDILLRGCFEEGDLNILQTWLDKFRAYNINIDTDANQILRDMNGVNTRGWTITALRKLDAATRGGEHLNHPPFTIQVIHSWIHFYSNSWIRLSDITYHNPIISEHLSILVPPITDKVFIAELRQTGG